MHQNTTIIIRKDRVNDNTPTGVQNGCPLLPVLFNIYTDKVIEYYQTKYFNEGLILNRVISVDKQVIVASTEAEMQ
jgi:hypothetical protein